MNHLFTCSPINKQAAIVTSQGGCEQGREYLERQELFELLNRLIRQRNEIGKNFVFYSKAHRSAFCRLIKNGKLDERVTTDFAAAKEYARLGEHIQKIESDLRVWRDIGRVVYALQSKNYGVQ